MKHLLVSHLQGPSAPRRSCRGSSEGKGTQVQTWARRLAFPGETSFLPQLHLGRAVPWPWVLDLEQGHCHLPPEPPCISPGVAEDGRVEARCAAGSVARSAQACGGEKDPERG